MKRLDALAQLTAAGQPYELVEARIGERTCRVFLNAPATLGELYASTRSDKPFLVYGEERLSFEAVWVQSCTLAAALVEEFGVKPGDRVAISMRNYPEWIIAFSAITSIGAIAVAMNALWQPEEMAFGLSHSGARVLLADPERLERLAAGPSQPKDLAVIGVRTGGAVAAGVRTYEAVMSRSPVDAMPKVPVEPDDDAIMLFTSGSTGHPKGAVSTHRNVISALLSWELDAHAAVLTGLVSAPAEEAAQTVALLGIPLFHVTGLHAVYLSCYRAQRRLVSMYKWDAAQAADLVEREGVTHFTAPAAVTGDLIELAARTGRDLGTLAQIGGGGAPRAPEQVRAIDRVFASARPATGWGMTETNAIGVGIAARDYLDHPDSSGQVSAVLDLRIVDETGRVLGPLERGELQVRGASIMKGYWNRPDANAETFVDGWLRTGDVAYVDRDGFVYIVDRIKDLVIRGGENIGCGAVEAALLEHPAVQEAAVYGVPDARLGEEVGATLYVSQPVDEDELRAFLEPRLARFQIPRYFRITDEPLPRIASGKILKRQLREEAVALLVAGQDPPGRP
jgi:long-chain acyl-CoA synthetase